MLPHRRSPLQVLLAFGVAGMACGAPAEGAKGTASSGSADALRIPLVDAPPPVPSVLPVAGAGASRIEEVTLALGRLHSCAILPDHSLKCWGGNAHGQLGLGDTRDRGENAGEMGDALPPVELGTARTAYSIAAGYDHTCVILEDGSVKCWGQNDHGQLGLGDTRHRGVHPGEMGDALPTVDLGKGRTAIALSAGFRHTCAILDTHALKCWGDNGTAQLGLEEGAGKANLQRRGGAKSHEPDIRDRGVAPKEMGDALPAVNLGAGRGAVAVSAGSYHTCAVLDDGGMKCWGDGRAGQLGYPNLVDNVAAPGPRASLGAHQRARHVLAKVLETCALFDDGTVACWGTAPNAGSKRPVVSPTVVNLGTGRKALALVGAYGHTCALLDDASVKCWGGKRCGRTRPGRHS
jgi:alpha-tubulin suppressor-like RCC1 family protein